MKANEYSIARWKRIDDTFHPVLTPETDVLLYSSEKGMFIATLQSGKAFGATHWMPLPKEPPDTRR